MEFTTLDQILKVLPLEILNRAFGLDIRGTASKLEFVEGNTIYEIAKIKIERSVGGGVIVIRLSLVTGKGDTNYDHSCILSERSKWYPVLGRIADDAIYGLLDYPQEYVDANKDKNCKIYLFSPEELYRTELVRMKSHSPKYCYQTESGMHVYQGRPEEGELCCKNNFMVLVESLDELISHREYAESQGPRVFRKSVLDSEAQQEYFEVISAMESVVTTMKRSSILDYAELSELLFCHIKTLKSSDIKSIVGKLKSEYEEATKKYLDKIDHKIAHVRDLISDFSEVQAIEVTPEELVEALDAFADRLKEVNSKTKVKPKKSPGRPKKSKKSPKSEKTEVPTEVPTEEGGVDTQVK